MNEMTVRLNKTAQKVKTFLRERELIPQGSRVCVCLSGGADSCVLLHILYLLRDEWALELSACHLNHRIRGAEADGDEQFCRELCEAYGIRFYSNRADVPSLQRESGKSLEETARDVRYAWFSALGKKEGIDLFATAHHKNDQAETVLFRILRGTTVAGLSGIPIRRDNVVRPLLCLSRSEIEQYAKETELAFRTDRTNFCEQYTRNLIRQKFLPLAEQINPSAVDAVVRLSRCAAEDHAFLESLLPPYEEVQTVFDLPDALLRRVVARNFTAVTQKTLCYLHVDEICRRIREGKNGKIGLPDGYHAVIADGTLSYQKEAVDMLGTVEDGVLSEGTVLLCGGAVRMTCTAVPACKIPPRMQKTESGEFVYNLSTEILLSCGGIYGMIRYRSRHAGDRMILHGVHRSVRKMMSEKKVPLSVRQMIPVLYDDLGILCVPFTAVTDRAYYRNTQNGGKLYLLRLEIAEHNDPKGG